MCAMWSYKRLFAPWAGGVETDVGRKYSGHNAVSNEFVAIKSPKVIFLSLCCRMENYFKCAFLFCVLFSCIYEQPMR